MLHYIILRVARETQARSVISARPVGPPFDVRLERNGEFGPKSSTEWEVLHRLLDERCIMLHLILSDFEADTVVQRHHHRCLRWLEQWPQLNHGKKRDI